MPLEGSYAVWNNRGGSGKTTLTYHLANKYASKNPDKTILLIDIFALLIYLDLYLVTSHKKHLYTIALEYKLISQR